MNQQESFTKPRPAVLPNYSNRVLQHPSFLPCYMESGYMLHPVSHTVPSHFFYIDPSCGMPGTIIPNLVTELKPDEKRFNTPAPIMSTCPAPTNRPDIPHQESGKPHIGYESRALPDHPTLAHGSKANNHVLTSSYDEEHLTASPPLSSPPLSLCSEFSEESRQGVFWELPGVSEGTMMESECVAVDVLLGLGEHGTL